MDSALEEQLKKQYAQQKKILKDTIHGILSDMKEMQDEYHMRLGKMRQGLIQEKRCLSKELTIQEDNEKTVEEINAFKYSERIGIVVNGVRYLITRQNIEKVSSILQIMISGKYSNRVDEDGNYVFDYDGDTKHFNLIFNYIRSGGNFNIPIMYIHSDLKEFVRASKFFGLKPLTNTLLEYAEFSDPGANENVMRATQSGGKATVIYYGFENGATAYNANCFNGGEDSSYFNNGCLIDQGAPSLPDRRNRSYRTNNSTGTCWTGNNLPDARGILVVDISGKDIPRRISTLQFYQMNADGRCTHVRVSRYPSYTSTPTHFDQNWVKMHDEEWLELSAHVSGNEEGSSYIQLSDEFNVEPHLTRYIKIECRNDGRHQNGYYIQLRQIKAFGRTEGEEYEKFD